VGRHRLVRKFEVYAGFFWGFAKPPTVFSTHFARSALECRGAPPLITITIHSLSSALTGAAAALGATSVWA
jgi:hypothetical protein